MKKNERWRWSIEQLSDLEIYDAIRYLEPRHNTRNKQNNSAEIVLCAVVVVIWLMCVWYLWQATF